MRTAGRLIARCHVQFRLFRIQQAFALGPIVFVFAFFEVRTAHYLEVVVAPTLGIRGYDVGRQVLGTSVFLIYIVVAARNIISIGIAEIVYSWSGGKDIIAGCLAGGTIFLVSVVDCAVYKVNVNTQIFDRLNGYAAGQTDVFPFLLGHRSGALFRQGVTERFAFKCAIRHHRLPAVQVVQLVIQV